MAPPSGYTEATFYAYLKGVIGGFSGLLAWTSQAHYQAAIDETMLALGVSDITTITGSQGIRRLRAFGRREVWRAVAQAMTVKLNDGGADRALSDKINFALSLAENECRQWGDGGWAIGVDTITASQDPYVYLPDDERSL